ncbi:lysylphosphatidylglycerol synthase transmembrane domain-containing protein [Thermofilum pendens]|uniref:Flippase-like domain-containing protein n=1 Tax=Thermofilum pendens (strain DSM 2475 / Hrk 5) TaxID=368408 RepID=A1RWN3_THEPD|nr:lysylphosphatidylglycerol synthase transmembrane domain-containing protein [Thermofilum pendens]ABL77613.1 hypothetical protein Tpen_0203 [Thermofilum pendens Hrk 5]
MKLGKRALVILLEVLVVLLVFVYTLYGFDVVSFIEALRNVDAWDILPIVVFELAYYFSHAAAFWLLCRKRFSISMWEALGGSMLAWLVDILLPGAFVEGDIARAIFLKTKSDWPSAVSYTIFFRFLINVTMVVFIVFTSLLAINLLKFYEEYLVLYLGIVVATLLASLLLVLVLTKPLLVKNVAVFLARKAKVKRLEKFEKDLENFLSLVAEASRDFNFRNIHLWGAVAFLFLQWVSGILTPFFSLRAVGANVNLALIGPGYTILTLYSLASIGIPFMVGSIDAALLSLYLLLGVPREKALAATIIGRSVTILTSLLVIYPIGMFFAKKVFSSRNISVLKESIKRAAAEYGFAYTFSESSSTG